jgi:dephospho-CoA kinase
VIVPLLIELGLQSSFDEVWIVFASDENQIKRLMGRDKLTFNEAKKRIKSQIPLKDKVKYADRIIDANLSIEETKEQVKKIWNELSKNNRVPY